MIYLDSSALVKLVVTEAESVPLLTFLSARAAEAHVTSALARVEVVRAVRHLGGNAAVSARHLLSRLDQIPVSDDVLDTAADVDAAVLRSLDAIHLSSARELETALTAFVTYDKRLAVAAADAGLPVHAPQ